MKEIKDFSNDVLFDYLTYYVKKPPKDEKAIINFKDLGDEFIKRREKVNDKYEPLMKVYLEHGIQEDENLHFYIRVFTSWSIPRRRCCRKAGHVAPFKFISDMFFERVRNAIIMANRTGGKTLSIAILNHLNMVFKPGCEIASAASTLKQAAKMHEHFKGFHFSRANLASSVLEKKFLISNLRDPITKSGAVYNNDSKIEILTGTEKGLKSPHPHKAIIDEVELMDENDLQAGLSMAITKGEIVGQNIFASTRMKLDGSFQGLLDKAKEIPFSKKMPYGYKVYTWCIWEVIEKCTRKCKDDDQYEDCPIYGICGGKAHKNDGFYDIDDFITKYVLLNKDVLEAEWLCLKPARRSLVYGDYWNPVRNILKAYEEREDKETGTIEIIDLKERRFDGRVMYPLGAIDFGATVTSPFVFLMTLVDVTDYKKALEEIADPDIIRVKPTFYIVYEYRAHSHTMERHAEKIKECPYYEDGMAIFADPSAKQERIDLDSLYNINTFEAITSVQPGIDLVKAHIWTPATGAPNLFIFDDYLDCKDEELIGTHVEFDRYRYKLDSAGRPLEILKKDDHGMDCIRYTIASGIQYFKEIFIPDWEEVEGDGIIAQLMRNS